MNWFKPTERSKAASPSALSEPQRHIGLPAQDARSSELHKTALRWTGETRKATLADLAAKAASASKDAPGKAVVARPTRPLDALEQSALGVKDEGRRAALAELARKGAPTAHLAFVIDATASRSGSWKEATSIQRRMVYETRRFGVLSLRVVHFGGNAVNAYPARWTESPEQVVKYMGTIQCVAGETQIVPAIDIALGADPPPTAIVAIGDTCEEDLCVVRKTGQALGKRCIPVFSFFDGWEMPEEFAKASAFRPDAGHRILAAESGGVFARFGDKLDLSSLMVATAAYVTGGAPALLSIAARSGSEGQAALTLVEQLRLPPPGRP